MPARTGQAAAAAATAQLPAHNAPVERGPLFERLSAAEAGAVVLVCAQAGSGKSMLLRSWAATAGLRDRVAWVSVERAEHDAQRFWLAAIDALADATGAVERVEPSPGFRGEAVVERLLCDLGALEAPVVLVIDDLHELRSEEALAWLELLLLRLPPRLGVVLATREHPRLGLHRLRLAGELTELGAPDLRFTREETRALLAAAGVTLSDEALALLHGRTEGWAAGLRLAAISLARHPEPERFVAEFSGSERTVAAYLVAEVLENQPAEVRELLLRTSVLERISGALADVLTGRSGSERILQQLEDSNAFVSSLDVGRSWFRCHHLFSDLLQLELRRLCPGAVDSLHEAASTWFGENGHPVEAVRHAQRAGAWGRAARLLADSYIDLILDGRMATVRGLLDAFPADVAAADAELALIFTAERLLAGKREESAAHVGHAQRLAGAVPGERRPRFDLHLGAMRLVVARWQGDLATVLDARQAVEAALAALPPSDRALSAAHRAMVLQNLGTAELWSSRPQDARRDLEQALALAREAGRPWIEIACLGHLAIAGPWTGSPLPGGLRQSEDALRIAEAHGWEDDPIILMPLAAGAMTLAWLGRFGEAEEWLERAQRVVLPDGEPGAELILHHARALLHLVQGRPQEALAAFRAAERMQALLADEHLLATLTRARLLQAQAQLGDPAATAAALAEVGAGGHESHWMRLVAANARLAEGDPEQALDVLTPVIEREAEGSHAPWARIETWLLDAAAREQLGDRRAAEASLEVALEVAERDGIVLPFLLTPVQALLERLPGHRTAHGALVHAIRDVLAGCSPQARRQAAPLADPLSEAELRVTRFLPTNLKAPEIAGELCVSANTVRTHIRHIYSKLDAHDRKEAVVRARELGLLAPSLRRDDPQRSGRDLAASR